MWLWLPLLWACSNGLTEESDAIFSQWTADSEALKQQLAQEPDALKRLHQITLLSEQFPGQTQDLCPLLSNETDQARCMQLNARPHLWAKETPKSETPLKSTTKTAIDSGCPKDAVFHSCVSKAAQEAAQRGQSAQVQGLCLGIESKKWASECLFSSAESMVQLRGAHGYGQALELCLAAEDFAENCLQHLVMLLAQNAPNANAASATAWDPIFKAERAIQTSWSWRNPERAERDIERLWSEAVARAFSAARPVGGGALKFLSTDKHPFIHAAVVRKLMELESPGQHGLEGWVQLTQTVLAQEHPQNEARNTAHSWADYADLWQESEHDSVALMGTTRREYSEDPEIDIAICVLETAARIPPIHSPLFESAQRSPSPQVQRTATRILSFIDKLETND